MDVHAHTHSPRKKWTHYFWEFLMLFLAVFCGFLAENLREHMVEHQRARQLANNLYKELVEDSISVQQCLANRMVKEKDCTYLLNYVKDSDMAHLSTEFFPAFASALIQIQHIIFEPNDGILTQLRNSGELRYFKSSEIQSEIGKLSVKIAYVRTRNDKEYSYIEFYNRPFILKYFDFDWYENFTQHGTITLVEALKKTNAGGQPGHLTNLETFNRKEAQSVANYFLLMMRSTRQVQYKEYGIVNHCVLELLRTEFHIK